MTTKLLFRKITFALVFIFISFSHISSCAVFAPEDGVRQNSTSGAGDRPGRETSQSPDTAPSIPDYTESLEKKDGFFPLYLDEGSGSLYMEIPAERLGREFLYLNSMATGGGMNGPRLDRAQIGNEHIARFQRTGSGISLVLSNTQFVSTDPGQPQLARSVEESFPVSIVGSFDIVAETEGNYLIDATSYFLRDTFDVRRLFRARNLGNFSVETSRSHIHPAGTDAFPENTEVQAAITYTASDPAWRLRRHAPDGRSVTMRQHHSFVKLPDDNFRPREYDPRGGYLNISFYDYSKGFDEDLITRYAVRHRLEKKDPEAELSEPVEPIVYYLDPAIPEPYRTAFRDGMEWFNGVFEEAGFINAFELRDMPEDMNPMDARYNVVMWVHRSEAGASIGPTFRDPRTGEIIKAAVRMDSHRSLVNYNQYAGLIPALDAMEPFGSMDSEGAMEWMAGLDSEVDAEEFVMARRRQHAAHELGHTLGLAHNFAAESMGRASVMDYPAAKIRLRDGKLDLSRAYEPGPGAFDTLSIRWGYTQFDPDEEKEGLETIIQEGLDKDLYHISAPHTRPFGSYPKVHAWTRAEDPFRELEEAMEVRSFLMEHFDERAVRDGEPYSLLRERFAPVYVHHRFILSSMIKHIGGMEFRYALRGDGQEPTRLIPAEKQRKALQAILETLHPDELAVPERIMKLMAPSPWGFNHDERSFTTPASPAADQLEYVRALTSRIFSEILLPQRTARVVSFHDRNPEMPALEEVLVTLYDHLFEFESGFDKAGRPAILRATQRMYIEELMSSAKNENSVSEARAATTWMLRMIAGHLDEKLEGLQTASGERDFKNYTDIAQYSQMKEDIRRFLQDGTFDPSVRPAPPMPDMFPLGG